jgi:hypothetical protein
METEAGASAQLCSQAGDWEQEAKDLHPSHNQLFGVVIATRNSHEICSSHAINQTMFIIDSS